jgi:hypothetical protein
MSGDRVTRLLKKDLKRAKEDHALKMEELGSAEDTSKNSCLGDW